MHERMVTKSKLLMPPPVGVSHELQTLLLPMISDTVSRIVKSDSLIMELARREFLRAGYDKDQHNHIRNKLRETAHAATTKRQSAKRITARFYSY